VGDWLLIAINEAAVISEPVHDFYVHAAAATR
jgi:hypothetical protein